MVDDSIKCRRCLKGKKGCKFSEPREEGEDEEEGAEDEAEENRPASQSPVAKLKKILSSPIRSLRKRKENDLSPESQKEKHATSSIAVRPRRETPSPEFVDFGSQVSMPPPSMISSRSQASSSSRLFFPTEDYRVQLLQSALRESEEDLTMVRERFASRESLYLEQIALLEKKLEEGSSKGQRGSKGRK